MITKNEFIRIMKMQSEIALATSLDNIPNVRIVNFYFETSTNTLLFATFADNQKIKEFQLNYNVAFSTVPHHGTEHVKAKGILQKSIRTIFDVSDEFVKKIPGYKDTIEQAGEYLELYEIKFDKATVTLDLDNTETISLID